MQKLLLATSNPGKVREIEHALIGHPWKIIPQSDVGIHDSVEETGLTFVENAILKARHASAFTGLPALADDSGLVVDALHGEPGVFSARYAGEGVAYATHMQKLLEAMHDIPDEKRSAHFYCVMVYLTHANDPSPIICQGIWQGQILHAIQGKEGFGYDPVFYVPTHNCSAAELPLSEKNRISHRGQALAQLVKILATAEGLWTKRNDLPDFIELRKSFDR
jgi:XTP/dITP diphosphohydrolase